jgi:hypothetical protein
MMILLKITFAVAMSVALGCGLFYIKQENIIFYPEALPQDFKYGFPFRFEEITLPVDGAAINALLFKADNPKGVILYFHGNAGSLEGWGDIAPEFTSRGYDILIPDYRGFGKSTGKIKNEEMLHRDAASAYNYLKERYPENKIIIYGRSIGTGIAVFLAKSIKPRSIILETPFFNLLDTAKYHHPYMPKALLTLVLRYPMRTDLWISDVSCPIYIFHGTKDEIVPYNSSERLFSLIKTEKKLVTIPGGGHNNLSDFSLYHEQLDLILK